MVADTLVQTVNRLVADGFTSDDELLRRFVATRDENAFAQLVRRHGPMVFGVCRRSLGHVQDAEDAFQATFLILARKAQLIRSDGVSRWLYGVAVRVAHKARLRRSRRRMSAADIDAVAAPPGPQSMDWIPILDAALARMPERDRQPILLCDLLGRSRAEAAAELGIAEGTLSSRLTRAREKLRLRLAHLGSALSAPALVAGLTGQATATVRPSLLESTIAASTSTSTAHELAAGVIQTMFFSKILKLAAASVLVLGAIGIGFAWLPAAGADPATQSTENPKTSMPTKEAPKADTDLARIQGTWIIESAKASPDVLSSAGTGFGGGRNNLTWANDAKGRTVTFTGDRVESILLPGSLRLFHLDPARDPKRIDFTFREAQGGLSGQRNDILRPSIYKFDGETLLIVLGDEELRERPDSFEWSGPKSPFVHLFLRRPTDNERKLQDSVEHDGLQGTWVGLLETVKGQEQPARDTQLVVKGNRLRFDVPGSDPLHATFTIDLASSPWHIDLTISEDGGGYKKGASVRGVFARHGVFLNLALGGADRPSSFETAGKDGAAYVFMRARTLSSRSALELLRPAGTSPPALKQKSVTSTTNKRLRDLQLERVKALEEQLLDQFERVKIGKDSMVVLLDAIRELADSERELATTRESRIAAIEKWTKQLREIEEFVANLPAGPKPGLKPLVELQTKHTVAQVRAARLKAEIELEKLKDGK
ncbi:MAG TPA: sigma-70 family RNA polymerase sigma factor [Gemmataceae bacterium]|jgi:RNA polymerase sigma factor (sigma-70 family)|nr:sigma-70 family RNA polymerase sigma factor [Gemmataceae bacterium]